MKNKYVFVTVMLLTLLLVGTVLTAVYVGYEKNRDGSSDFIIITSFYPMYIAAGNIVQGCDGVLLENLSEPQTGCMHDYQLTTADMKKLSTADAFVVNGGGIERFLSEVGAQYPELSIVNASGQIALLEDNAHAWMSISDYMTQVETITDELCTLDKSHERQYRDNCSAYLAKLEKLLKKQQEVLSAAYERVVIFHEALAYVARDYGLTIAGTMDLDEERQVSAGETADIIRLVQEDDVRLILAEELYGREMCETIKKEADVTVVYLDTCTRGAYTADSYLKAMEENIRLMEQALLQ